VGNAHPTKYLLGETNMNIQAQTINKIGQMPDSLVREISDYIDYLLWKDGQKQLAKSIEFEQIEIVESDFTDYLSNLEEYETRLANGEIKW
jgi:hypothetical protein